MTHNQKTIISLLLQGYSIAQFRLRSPNQSVFMKVTEPTYFWLKRNFLRKTKDGLFVIDKRKVRQLHGNSWIKREYKNISNGA